MSVSDSDVSAPLLARSESPEEEREPPTTKLAVKNLGVGGLAWIAQGGILLAFVTLWTIVVSNPAGACFHVSTERARAD
jgi:hypothetical protein